ncbi:hypothetical protein LguiB_031650 [Lonicera macranthoides]
MVVYYSLTLKVKDVTFLRITLVLSSNSRFQAMFDATITTSVVIVEDYMHQRQNNVTLCKGRFGASTRQDVGDG